LILNKTKMETNLNPRDEMLLIMKTIWSSRTLEQIKGCENMLQTYIQKHGDNNFGTTFIEIEMPRQRRLNGLFAKMGEVQNALAKDNAEKKKSLKN